MGVGTIHGWKGLSRGRRLRGAGAALWLGLAAILPAEAQLFRQAQSGPSPTPLLAQPVPNNPYANPGSPAATPAAAVLTPPPSAQPLVYHWEQPPAPSFALPHSDYRYQRRSAPRGFFTSSRPSREMLELIHVVRTRAEHLSRFGLDYTFGGDHPSEGGMDCSGTMRYLLSGIGFTDMPRTSFQQYEWLRQHRTLRHSKSIPDHMGGRRGIKPGDLIFWGGTYNSGHRVSHVMLYLGQGDDGTHYMFGARGRSRQGIHGNGVDIFRLSSGYQKNLVGFGTLPGVH